jgi:inner membrane protein
LDNLTHTLTGLMLGRAAVGRLVPRAGILMMVAANAPDSDLVSWAGGTAAFLRYHRGITHSLAFSPVMALLGVAVVFALERRRFNWALAWLFSWIGVLSHVALDYTNVYGIRLFLPFSDYWARFDTVNVVDLAVWAVLLLGVAAPALGKLVSSEIGARQQGSGRGWATAVLLLLAVYEAGRYVAHDRAMRILEARVYEGENPVRVAAFAQTANPFAWRGLVEMPQGYIVFPMNLLEEFDPTGGRMFYKAQPGPAIEAAKKTNEFDALIAFSSFPLWRVTPDGGSEGSSKVELFDLRFGTPLVPGLEASAIVDANGAVRSAAVNFGRL